MRNVSLTLFYLLLLLLPTQLGRHFFFGFSYVAGVRNDYLAPTVYLTDIIIFLMTMSLVVVEIKDQRSKIKNTYKKLNMRHIFLLFVLFYLLFNSLVIASNGWVASYKLLKIVEFVLLGMTIVKIKPQISYSVYILSMSVFYSSLVAIFQFWQQKSLGGLLYFLGERSFNAATPGIAATSIGGGLFLRPYATFPHPNVLGGFLAVVLPTLLLIINNSKFVVFGLFSSFLIGGAALFLSFSRAAWIVAGFGFFLVFYSLLRKNGIFIFWSRKREVFLLTFYFLMILSVVILLLFRFDFDNWRERADLVNGALRMVIARPLFGVGLNNSITTTRDYLPQTYDLYIFQPVHNIYLLLISEVGLVGFMLFLLLFLFIYRKILTASSLVVIAAVQLAILGMFDHYLWTLQQGQLLLTVFISLAFLPQKNYA